MCLLALWQYFLTKRIKKLLTGQQIKVIIMLPIGNRKEGGIMAYNKFKGWMVENHVKQSDLGDLLHLNITTVNNKLNRRKGADFSTSEIRMICNHYRLSADQFFLF
jgi:hypothetical protein